MELQAAVVAAQVVFHPRAFSLYRNKVARRDRVGHFGIDGERRVTRRYELHLPVQYRVSQHSSMPVAGTGISCDISTSGISFRCRRSLPVGSHIELVIDWPARYADLYALDLQVTGFVVRSQGNRIGVRLNSRKFRMSAAATEEYRVSA